MNLLLIIYYQDQKEAETNWDNVVTACSSCNVKKGGKLLKHSGMMLNQNPYRPSTEDLHKNGKNFPPNFLHKSWMDYLYWDVELRVLNFFRNIYCNF